MPRVERRHRPREERPVARSEQLRERRVLDEPHDLVGARRRDEFAALEVAVHLRPELGFGLRGVRHAHEVSGGRPLPYVRVGPAGDRLTPRLGTAEEGIRERQVHPAREVRVVRRVRPRHPVSVDVLTPDLLVQPHDPGARVLRRGPVAVRDGVDPPDGAGEPPERVLAVARVVDHTGERTRVECLDQQRPDAREHGLPAAVDAPRRGPGAEVPGVRALLEGVDPLGTAGRAAGEGVVESGAEGVRERGHAPMFRPAPDTPPRDRRSAAPPRRPGARPLGWTA